MGLFKKKLRIAILISGRGSNMQAIVKACRSGKIDGKVVLVVSDQPDAAGLEFCRENRVPAKYIHPGKFKTKLEGSAEQEYIRAVCSARPDLIVLAGFMRVVKPAFIQAFPNRIINIHPSLLPKYPGLHTHRRAIEAGDSESGCTVHFVNEEVDVGKRIMQARVPINPGDTEDDLAKRVLRVEHEIFPTVCQLFAEGKVDYDSFPNEPILYTNR